MVQNQTPKSGKDIERKAIDSFGILGSFYDARRDQIVKHHQINSRIQSSEFFSSSPFCTIEKGPIDEHVNLLRLIGIQNELRLNLLLDITKRVGIAAVLNYSRRIDEFTRFFYYSKITRQERGQLVEESENSQATDATHLISTIDFGIDFIAVLQLPSEKKVSKNIDEILNKIRHILLTDHDNPLVLTNDEEHLLEKLVHITTYSNISSLMAISNLSDLLCCLARMKTMVNHCHPLTYYLQSRASHITFPILSNELSEQIERYILQFRTPIKYLEASLNQHMPEYLYGHLQDRIYQARQHCLLLKDDYIQATKRIRQLLLTSNGTQLDIQQFDFGEKNVTLKTSIEQLMKEIANIEDIVRYDTNIESPSDHETTTETDSLSEMSNNLVTTDSAVEISSSSSSLSSETNPIPQKPVVPRSNEVYNVLLLGETGVGKSLFVNAFMNYLTYDRFDQAESDKTAVLIPVSFQMTVGENAEEKTIEFGDSDNENFRQHGQSVTQHCKTYVFHLDDGSKLCLIDTPAINQDNHNLEEIFQYIQHYTHINAICFLLKPNLSRLNPFVRSCLTQLFDYLGVNISQRLTFCFTNTRPTFFTPGNTAPLLNSLFDSLPSENIPFNSENTFCFDSEAFRYLVARNQGLSFHPKEKSNYELSWSTSLNESHRLINYIRTKLTPYSLTTGWKSIKHAQFQINHLIRPLVETVRNTLRNITLWNIESPNQSIELRPIVIHRPIYLCLSCPPKIIKVGNFGIIADVPHDIRRACCTSCQCSPNKHIPIDYLLDYKLLNRPSTKQISELKDQLAILRDACIEFAYFLRHVACCTKQNELLVQLIRMIEQETYICRRSETNYLNVQLVKELVQWKQRYEERTSNIISKDEHGNLNVIYQWIESMRELPMMNEQLNAIGKSQEILMKQHEIQPMQI
ncbi:unnamed protein product [Adineta ricciae]|uniref:G domain-containing protein n=1 Tax=Adineta ricciae TaxID=249248 RepID=A0A815NN97_ADIRI|nr:unnamed protein product [Adineta ricciae]